MDGMRDYLPPVGQLPDGSRRFELPAPISRHGQTVEAQAFRFYLTGADVPFDLSHPPRQVDLLPGTHADDQDLDPATLTSSERLFVDAQAVIARHASLVNQVCENAGDEEDAVSEGIIAPFEHFVNVWHEALKDDAKFSLIVTIARDLPPLFSSICRSPRRILRRERQQQKLHRVQQVDPACLRWLARQPGRDVLQRAGSRQSLLAVVRVEHADTLENRVIRDFALRAIRAATRYAIVNREFPDSVSVKLVNALRRLLARLLRESDIGSASLLSVLPEPNYVLMFDERYSRMWPLYLRLRREEQEIDDLWRWRHRTWSEIVMSLTLIALDELTRRALTDARLTRGFIHISSEAQHGMFIRPRSDIPAYVVGQASQWLCRAVLSSTAAPSDPRLTKLWSLGPDFVLWCIRPSSPFTSPLLIGIWTEFSPSQTFDDVMVQAQSLEKTLKISNIPNVSGIFAVLARREDDSARTMVTSTLPGEHKSNVFGVRLPLDQASAKDVMFDLLPKVLAAST